MDRSTTEILSQQQWRRYGDDAPEPLANAIETFQQKDRKYDEIIYMTPDGERLNQRIANQLSLKENLLIICGHYKGIDQRIREQYVTKEISIGDYVLSVGEELGRSRAYRRNRPPGIPGVLNDETSALSDLFPGQPPSPRRYIPALPAWRGCKSLGDPPQR